MRCHNQTLLNPVCAAQSVGPANQLFVSLFQTLLAAQCSISPTSVWPPDYGSHAIEHGLDEYDFIVIGGGSAGATVAGRLSEVSNWKVLLLEAGGNPPIETELPGMALTQMQTRVDWKFYSEPTNACKGSKTGRCYIPRGKMLGGTGGINTMMHVRGNRHNYDGWAASGNTGWNYDSVLPYFKKSEGNQYQPFLLENNGYYHNGNGPLKVSFGRPLTAVDQLFIAAAKELGIPYTEDINGQNYTGMSFLQSTVSQGRRQTSANAFLLPVKKNLHIIRHAYVKKILINKNKRAYGVKFTINGKHKMKAIAKREVILSAGTIMSPVILQRSGIGPKQLLKKHKIKCKANLAGVGQNLMDHMCIQIWYTFTPSGTAPVSDLDSIFQLAVHNQGSLNATGYLSALLNVYNRTGDPDHQPFYAPIPQNTPSTAKQIMTLFDMSESITNQLLKANEQYDVVGSLVFMLVPHFRGTVELCGESPCSKPTIKPNYLDNDFDRDTVLQTIKEQVSFVNTKSFQAGGGSVLRFKLDECDALEYQSDAYWKCYMKYMSAPGSHFVGTSKMGPNTDPMAVVDPRLRVYKIKGLRQIDAGVMPMIPSGNVNAPTVMVAEKGADMIKEDNLLKSAN